MTIKILIHKKADKHLEEREWIEVGYNDHNAVVYGGKIQTIKDLMFDVVLCNVFLVSILLDCCGSRT